MIATITEPPKKARFGPFTSVDTPDVDCHWYVTAPDNTFGEGFSWENAPWFSAEGLRDVGDLNYTMTTIHSQALSGN